ncbi:M15 family metallopeptidase, partial [Candidatus Saccharibacteria bacterium]|nr:M15 family metallopeptidase [Candidatus Saccharibacteria bacterium]
LPMADNSSRLVGYKENESWQNILGAYHEDVIAELERGVDPGLGEVKLAYSYREDPADQEEFMYYFIDIAEHEPKDSEIDQLYQSKLADKSLLLSLLNKLDHSDLEIVPEVYADESSNHQATESIRNQMIAANPRARLFGDVQGQVLGSDNKGVFGAIVKVTFEIQVSNCLECDWAFVRAKDILTPAEVAAVKQGTLQSIGSSANEFAPRYKETSIELVTDEEGWWSLSSIGLLVDCNTSGGHPPTKIKYKVYDIFDGDISDLPSSIGEADLNYVGVNSVTSIVGGSAPTQSIGTSQAGIVNVGGINVAQSIAGNLAKMLDAAKADGVNLSGGGYRSNATQVQLRISHCGSSNYAIYQMPSSQCSPPTARPGKSNHEKGLAIDFNNCSSRSTACYRWLNANANQYGFYNLPSESWHWSVNGK